MLIGKVRVMMMVGVKVAVLPMGPMGSVKRPYPPRFCSASLNTAAAPSRLLFIDEEPTSDQARLSPDDLAKIERLHSRKDSDWEALQTRLAPANSTKGEIFLKNRTWPDVLSGRGASRRSVQIEKLNHVQSNVVNGKENFVIKKAFKTGRNNPLLRQPSTALPKTSELQSISAQGLPKLQDSTLVESIDDYERASLPHSTSLSFSLETLDQPAKSAIHIFESRSQGKVSSYNNILYSGSESQLTQSRIPCMQGTSPSRSNTSQDLAKPKVCQWDYWAEVSSNQTKCELTDCEKELQLSRLPQYAPRLKSSSSSLYIRNRQQQLQTKMEAYTCQKLLQNGKNNFQVPQQLPRVPNSTQLYQQLVSSGQHQNGPPVSQLSLNNSERSLHSSYKAWNEEGEIFKAKHKGLQNVSALSPEAVTICSPTAHNETKTPIKRLTGQIQAKNGSFMEKSDWSSEDDNLEHETNSIPKSSCLTFGNSGNAEQINSLRIITANSGPDFWSAGLEWKASVNTVDFQKQEKLVLEADFQQELKKESEIAAAGTQDAVIDWKLKYPYKTVVKDAESQQPYSLQQIDTGSARLPVYEEALTSQVQVVDAVVHEMGHPAKSNHIESRKEMVRIDDVLVINNVVTAKAVVEKLTGQYRHLVHACDTEVAGIDVKEESPVDHGYMTCFSIYCGPDVDFGDGKSRLWIDVLDSNQDVLESFKEYFEDPGIKKVWHNFSFDRHILANHGMKAGGFHADTMHLARLWDSARKGAQGGYSLEALTSDPSVMEIEGITGGKGGGIKKTSMKDLFGRSKVKRDGTKGKLITVPPVEELQRSGEDRAKWISYSAGDAVSTWHLWKSLENKLKHSEWKIEGVKKGNMYDFYKEYWQPFGELLVQMESDGMLVDHGHLADIEKIAHTQQQIATSRFKKWACKYCPDALHMNVGSDAQIRQILFGGTRNRHEPSSFILTERVFQVPNTENYIEEGKKVPKKFRPIVLHGIGVSLPVDSYTSAGWPAVGGAALKSLAGNVAIDYSTLEDENEEIMALDLPEESTVSFSESDDGKKLAIEEENSSIYGKAYEAFGRGEKGKDACIAIAALCEVASINTLISNFIQPLQGGQIVGSDGRVHCSLNINTETGRLSARRPSLQNQPALEKDRYKIRQAFVAGEGKSLVVADYGQLELRILAHLANCKSMLEAFEAGGDFHSRTAMNMYSHVREAVDSGLVILEWNPKPGELKPPAPLLKDVFASERRKAKMLNFSLAYGKTARGLSKDWKVSLSDAEKTLELWYKDRMEVKEWQEQSIAEARATKRVHTLLGRTRHLPNIKSTNYLERGHAERAAINTPVQGSAADVAMCAMLEISCNRTLKELGYKLVLQIHDEVILEGPTNFVEDAKKLVLKSMSYPFNGKNWLRVKLDVDCNYADSWYAAK